MQSYDKLSPVSLFTTGNKTYNMKVVKYQLCVRREDRLSATAGKGHSGDDADNSEHHHRINFQLDILKPFRKSSSEKLCCLFVVWGEQRQA